MNKKLISVVLAVLLIGGIGSAVVYNKMHKETAENEMLEVTEEENTSDDDNLDKEMENTEDNVNNNPDSGSENNEGVVEPNNNIINENTPNNSAPQPQQQPSEPSKAPAPKQDNSPAQPNTNVNDNTNNDVRSSENFMSQVEQLIYNKVNEQRAANGLGQLSYNKTMEKYARIKSKDMGDNNYLDHKDLSGNLITVKMQNDGVTYNAWAENIAYISGVSDANALADQFMTNWMNSEGHRKNILTNNCSSIGVGVYKIGNKVYATQEFYR